MIVLSINESFTYPPNIKVIISNVTEIWFWNSYLPTFLHDVMKYPGFFLDGVPNCLCLWFVMHQDLARIPSMFWNSLVLTTNKNLYVVSNAGWACATNIWNLILIFLLINEPMNQWMNQVLSVLWHWKLKDFHWSLLLLCCWILWLILRINFSFFY